MAILKFKSVLVLIGMTIIAGESSTMNQIFLEMIKYYIYFLPGEALGSQEKMTGFEKMDAKTWQTLAEFIVSKYREKCFYPTLLSSTSVSFKTGPLLMSTDAKRTVAHLHHHLPLFSSQFFLPKIL